MQQPLVRTADIPELPDTTTDLGPSTFPSAPPSATLLPQTSSGTKRLRLHAKPGKNGQQIYPNKSKLFDPTPTAPVLNGLSDDYDSDGPMPLVGSSSDGAPHLFPESTDDEDASSLLDPRVRENPRPGVRAKDSDDEAFSQHAEFLKAAAIILSSEHNSFRAPEHVSGEVPPPTDEPGEGETREAADEGSLPEPAPPTPTAPVSFSPHPLPALPATRTPTPPWSPEFGRATRASTQLQAR